MKEVVKDILKEEETARNKISKATQEAARIISDAKAEAENIVRQAGADAKESIKRKQEETEKTLFSEKETVIFRTRQETVAGIEKKKNDISRLAGETFRDIISL
jgi:vacuolar-type H+-ATPase subunit H